MLTGRSRWRLTEQSSSLHSIKDADDTNDTPQITYPDGASVTIPTPSTTAAKRSRIIRAAIKGRTGTGGRPSRSGVRDGVVYFRPPCPATVWRRTSARDVVGHWRKAGRSGAGRDDGAETPAVLPKEQLSLSGTHT
jgi:hypothetical protein